MTVAVVLHMEPSKYKHRGKIIYRAIVPGGSVWMFEHDGCAHVTASLFAAKNKIDEMIKNTEGVGE